MKAPCFVVTSMPAGQFGESLLPRRLDVGVAGLRREEGGHFRLHVVDERVRDAVDLRLDRGESLSRFVGDVLRVRERAEVELLDVFQDALGGVAHRFRERDQKVVAAVCVEPL